MSGLVVDGKGKIIYAHSEDLFGDIADPNALLNACKSASQLGSSKL